MLGIAKQRFSALSLLLVSARKLKHQHCILKHQSRRGHAQENGLEWQICVHKI